MRIHDQYDLIVIGDQLSGYILGAMAAQAGKRVLIIEGNTKESSLYAKPSGQFLGELYWEPVLGLDSGSEMDRALRGLGLYDELNALFPLLSPSVQVISDHCRIDFDYDLDRLMDEWLRECPYEKESLCRMTQDWLGRHGSVFGSSSFSSLLQKHDLNLAWQQIGQVHSLLYGSILFEDIPMNVIREITDNAAKGVRFVRGGIDVLKERLISRLQLFGGQVKRDTWVEEIIFEKGRLSGVLLSTYEGFVRTNAVVGSMGAGRFVDLIPPENRSESLLYELKRLHPTHWRFCYSITLPKTAIPEGMAKHVCIYEHEIDYIEHDILQMFLLDQDSVQGVKEDEAVLLVRMLLPYQEKSIRPEYLRTAIRRSLGSIGRYIPFFEEYPCRLSPDPEDIENDTVFRRHFQFKSIDYIPSNLLVYGSTATTGLEANWRKFGLDGLAISSRDVQPSLGLLGEALTAQSLCHGLGFATSSPATTH